MAIPNMEILRVASMRIGPLSVGVGRRLYCSQVYGLLLFCSHIFAVRRNYSHTVLLSTGLVKEIRNLGREFEGSGSMQGAESCTVVFVF